MAEKLDYSLKVKDLDAVNEAMRLLGTPVKEIQQAGYEAALIVARAAKNDAPVRSGNLMRSIRAAKVVKGAAVRAGSQKVPYANPIHWGWFYDKKNFVYKNIKPNRFLIRALGYNFEEVRDTYLRNIDKLLKNVSDRAKLKSKVE